MGGKYHNTFAGILLVFLASALFTFHLDIPQVGHEDASFNSFLYSMQSFGHACIFLYSIPNAFNVFFASYMDKGISLLTGSISPNIWSKSEKLLSDHPYRAFTLYNLTNAESFVNFMQPDYKFFSASSSNFLNGIGSVMNSSSIA